MFSCLVGELLGGGGGKGYAGPPPKLLGGLAPPGPPPPLPTPMVLSVANNNKHYSLREILPECIQWKQETWKFHEKKVFQKLQQLKILIRGDN